VCKRFIDLNERRRAMSVDADVIVVGAGIAGASAAAFMVGAAKVVMLEAESQPGYHTTGRSAATFIENYGAPSVRMMTRASAAFLRTPPAGFCDGAIVSARGLLYLARESEVAALDTELAVANGMARLNREQALTLVPALVNGPTHVAGHEPDAQDIDVNQLHQGYLRMFTRGGGTLVCDARVASIRRSADVWTVQAGSETYTAPTLVNAAGAWGDELASLAGVAALGLQPLRRSIAVVELDAQTPLDANWPLLAGVSGDWYCKPESGKLWVSPADETPSPPCDAYPDDFDLAVGVERMQQATGFMVKRQHSSWAGLRTFAPDRQLVNGFDPDVVGFYWLVGQGGYGIQTSAAMGLACARSVLRDGSISFAGCGPIDAAVLGPERLRV
jgi:D-arginine dehydrogenase